MRSAMERSFPVKYPTRKASSGTKSVRASPISWRMAVVPVTLTRERICSGARR